MSVSDCVRIVVGAEASRVETATGADTSRKRKTYQGRKLPLILSVFANMPLLWSYCRYMPDRPSEPLGFLERIFTGPMTVLQKSTVAQLSKTLT